MVVKKFKGKVYGAELTADEKKAMNMEIKRQIAEAERQHTDDISILVLYVLHTYLGFGKKRLRRFYEVFDKEYEKLAERYEMPDDDVWIADHKLKEIGVDVSEWNREREGRQNGSDNGQKKGQGNQSGDENA